MNVSRRTRMIGLKKCIDYKVAVMLPGPNSQGQGLVVQGQGLECRGSEPGCQWQKCLRQMNSVMPKFGDCRFSHAGDMIACVKIEKGSCDHDHAPFKGDSSALCWDLAYYCTKFDHSSFSRSRDIIDAYQNLNASCDLTTPLSGMVCRPQARTFYYQVNQPVNHIWSLYLRPLWRYEKG